MTLSKLRSGYGVEKGHILSSTNLRTLLVVVVGYNLALLSLSKWTSVGANEMADLDTESRLLRSEIYPACRIKDLGQAQMYEVKT